MTRRLASSSVPARPLAGASTLARGAPSRPLAAAVGGRERAPPAPAGGLQELERLDVDEVLVLAHDVRLAHRLQELLRPVEIAQPDLDATEPLGDVAVRPRPRHDRVLAGEAHRLLVECREGDSRVEDLEDVDLVHDLEQVLVVGYRVQTVEGVRNVDQAALPPDLGDRLLQAHPARDLLLDEEADYLALVLGLHL